MPNHSAGRCKLFLTVVLPEPFGPANIRSRGGASVMASRFAAHGHFLAPGEDLEHGHAFGFAPNQLAVNDVDPDKSGLGCALTGRGQHLHCRFRHPGLLLVFHDISHVCSLEGPVSNYTRWMLTAR